LNFNILHVFLYNLPQLQKVTPRDLQVNFFLSIGQQKCYSGGIIIAITEAITRIFLLFAIDVNRSFLYLANTIAREQFQE